MDVLADDCISSRSLANRPLGRTRSRDETLFGNQGSIPQSLAVRALLQAPKLLPCLLFAHVAPSSELLRLGLRLWKVPIRARLSIDHSNSTPVVSTSPFTYSENECLTAA